jgi:Carbohydrate family 9 binding domain-like
VALWRHTGGRPFILLFICGALWSCDEGPPHGGSAAPAPETAASPSVQAPATPQTRPPLAKGSRVPAAALRPGGSVVIDAEFDDEVWRRAPIVRWDSDYAGLPTGVVTEAQLAWTAEALFVAWSLEGVGSNSNAERPVGVEHPRLYLEDCVELFIAPHASEPRRYFEIEVGPLGHFFDLAVDRVAQPPTHDVAWSAGLEIATKRNAGKGTARIEVAIRARELSPILKSGVVVPLGLFRIDGKDPRRYLAWRPPRTSKPNFHVPKAFGRLVLEAPP